MSSEAQKPFGYMRSNRFLIGINRRTHTILVVINPKMFDKLLPATMKDDVYRWRITETIQGRFCAFLAGYGTVVITGLSELVENYEVTVTVHSGTVDVDKLIHDCKRTLSDVTRMMGWTSKL